MRYIYGVDLGGTAVKLGLFDGDGDLLEKWEIPTDRSDGGRNIPESVAAEILRNMGARSIGRRDCLGVGIGVPGQVWPDGTVDAENLGWVRFPLPEPLRERLGLRVEADNDANAAAMGEYWRGSGRGAGSMALVTLGTGVGCGIILGGRRLRGAHLAAGEIGHIRVEPGETRACACGGHGCLEQYASAAGCARMARETLEGSDIPSLLRDVSELDARAVWEAAKAGDRLALEVTDRFCGYLGRGLAMLADTVDPEVIVLGGGVSGAGRALTDRTAAHYRRFALSVCRDTPIVTAKLGNDAGICGAAAMLLS